MAEAVLAKAHRHLFLVKKIYLDTIYMVYIVSRYIFLVFFTRNKSSLGIQYTFKALKITYCCMCGYLQKYLHKFHKVKSKV